MKCPSLVYYFENLVPSWWFCWNLEDKSLTEEICQLGVSFKLLQHGPIFLLSLHSMCRWGVIFLPPVKQAPCTSCFVSTTVTDFVPLKLFFSRLLTAKSVLELQQNSNHVIEHYGCWVACFNLRIFLCWDPAFLVSGNSLISTGGVKEGEWLGM
jgi:hypothetical protein